VKVFFFILLFSSQLTFGRPLVIGSKKFTESVILSEILRLGLRSSGTEAIHRKELGGTTLLWNALKNGDIDIYPEYSGTLQEEILQEGNLPFEEMKEKLRSMGIGISAPLGFNDTYAIGLREERARDLGITKISDLNSHPKLRFGFASEFMERRDGWPGLSKEYELRHKNVRGIDHDVAYRALDAGEIDVIDLYSTDAEIPYYKIRVLEDDLSFFPPYEAVFLYRLEEKEKLLPFLTKIEGSLSESEMSDLNRAVKIEKKPANEVASKFLKRKLNIDISFRRTNRVSRLIERSLEHAKLVSISLFFAVLFAIPLGILAAKNRHLGNLILITVSTIQTIPALALLVLLIRPLTLVGLPGIGDTPALIALFLYSLLPIVRNTHAGITQIPLPLQETAAVLNLSRKTRLLKIELPLALPLILAGIKTSLVLNIGFATLGALIGAGGYGQSILTGIRLDNYALIMEGAIPAALLAILTQQFFEVLEKKIVSRGLRS
jgi:osmoprotectant transport system permease protein